MLNLKKKKKKKILMNLFVKTNKLTDIENKLMTPKGESGGRDKLGGCDEQIHTTT